MRKPAFRSIAFVSTGVIVVVANWANEAGGDEPGTPFSDPIPAAR